MSRHNKQAMSDRYLNHYRILGLRPEAGWLELRQAYKSLVNIWHPDRFQHDAQKQRLAEEKTKEITQSYKELAEYYKHYGALPQVFDVPEAPPVVEEAAPAANDTPEPQPDAANQDTAPEVDLSAPAPEYGEKKSRFASRAIAAAVLVLIVYLLLPPTQHNGAGDQSRGGNPPGQESDTQSDPGPTPSFPAVEPAPEKESKDTGDTGSFFTVGTSLGEVYAIQGVPTKTDPDVWYYGKSKVYFAKGKVVRWEESPENPLRAELNPVMDKIRMAFFGKGSTKKQVLAIQGAPDRDAGDVWDYGVSRVYFEDGRVKGWDDSAFNPLKVHH